MIKGDSYTSLSCAFSGRQDPLSLSAECVEELKVLLKSETATCLPIVVEVGCAPGATLLSVELREKHKTQCFEVVFQASPHFLFSSWRDFPNISFVPFEGTGMHKCFRCVCSLSPGFWLTAQGFVCTGVPVGLPRGFASAVRLSPHIVNAIQVRYFSLEDSILPLTTDWLNACGLKIHQL